MSSEGDQGGRGELIDRIKARVEELEEDIEGAIDRGEETFKELTSNVKTRLERLRGTDEGAEPAGRINAIRQDLEELKTRVDQQLDEGKEQAKQRIDAALDSLRELEGRIKRS